MGDATNFAPFEGCFTLRLLIWVLLSSSRGLCDLHSPAATPTPPPPPRKAEEDNSSSKLIALNIESMGVVFESEFFYGLIDNKL